MASQLVHLPQTLIMALNSISITIIPLEPTRLFNESMHQTKDPAVKVAVEDVDAMLCSSL